MPPDKSLIKGMSLEEKYEWLEAIWISIEAAGEGSEIPEWHRETIQKRLARMESDPHPGFTVDEMFSKLASRRK